MRKTLQPRLAIPLALLCLTAGAGSAQEQQQSPVAVPTPTAVGCGAPADDVSPPTDLAIVIDTSSSTRRPTGADIDQDGRVGEFRRSEYTDPDDSLLAAEVAAVRRFVRAASGDGMRFAIISFAHRSGKDSVGLTVSPRDARLHAELTGDVALLETALSRVFEQGSDGSTSFVPAMRLALRSLSEGPSETLAVRRRVLFLSDSEKAGDTDRRVELEARRAIKAGIAFDAFGVGSAADAEPPHALAEIAGTTGGTYHAVRDPRSLDCALLAALREAPQPVP